MSRLAILLELFVAFVDLVLKSGWYSHTIVIGGWLLMWTRAVANVWQKKNMLVSAVKNSSVRWHTISKPIFFSVVCTRVYNEPFRFHFIVVEQYWRLMSGHNKPDMVIP